MRIRRPREYHVEILQTNRWAYVGLSFTVKRVAIRRARRYKRIGIAARVVMLVPDICTDPAQSRVRCVLEGV